MSDFLLRVGDRDTHDYTEQCWGHALHDPKIKHETIKPKWWRKLLGAEPIERSYLTCLGHGYGIKPGHTVLLKMQSGKVASFRVVEIEYFSNPRDMFDIKRADFIEYVSDEGTRP